MGIYDRGYYQETGEAQWTGGSSVVMKLVVVNFVIAILDLFTPEVAPGGSHWLTEQMALPSNLWQRPWDFWKLLTSGFAHESLSVPRGIFHVAWNMYALWLFGRAVEGVYGAREFLRIYVSLIVGSGLIWVLLHLIFPSPAAQLVGASGAVTGIIILFVLHFPTERFLVLFIPFPVQAWVIGLVIIGMDLLGAMGLQGDRVAFSVHLAGAALAYLYYRSGIRLTSLLGNWRFPRNRARANLRVHRDDPSADEIERRADEILAKINRHGAESITAEERRILNTYSRRMRQKHS